MRTLGSIFCMIILVLILRDPFSYKGLEYKEIRAEWIEGSQKRSKIDSLRDIHANNSENWSYIVQDVNGKRWLIMRHNILAITEE